MVGLKGARLGYWMVASKGPKTVVGRDTMWVELKVEYWDMTRVEKLDE